MRIRFFTVLTGMNSIFFMLSCSKEASHMETEFQERNVCGEIP
jgi:hypothetical protein